MAIDWASVSGTIAVISFVWACSAAVRSKVKTHTERGFKHGVGGVRLIIENQGLTTIIVHKITVIPLSGMKIGIQEPGIPDKDEPWVPVEPLPIEWQDSLPVNINVAPGKQSYFDFFAKSRKRVNSCAISVHVDESRWILTNRIRQVILVKNAVIGPEN